MHKKIWAYLEKTLQNNDIILMLILFNSIVIFIQEFKVESFILNFLETIFTIAFILELHFKVKTRSFKTYISTGWNKLDFILILVSIPSLFSIFMFDLKWVLVFRVFRIFKFFRLLKYFPRIDSILPGLRRAIKVSYLIFFGFCTMVFIFSMISCAMFKDIAPEYFSNPIDSMFSMFKIFTVEGWNAIPDLIAQRSSYAVGLFSRIYFSVLMFFGGILGLSIVNSILVDAALSDDNDHIMDELRSLREEVARLNKNIEEKDKVA